MIKILNKIIDTISDIIIPICLSIILFVVVIKMFLPINNKFPNNDKYNLIIGKTIVENVKILSQNSGCIEFKTPSDTQLEICNTPFTKIRK